MKMPPMNTEPQCHSPRIIRIREIAPEEYSGAFHTMRSMLLPVLYLLTGRVPKADVYHAISTGYGGLLACLGGSLNHAPVLLTEHGIYTREREEEIIRAEWVVPSFKSRWIRVFSVFLCACMALGCVWAQQGLTALDNMTNGLLTGAEANKITKEPFVIYLSGVDTRGELTEKARSDVNILAVVNPQTKQVALINTPRDYYVDLAGTNSKDKLTHAGLYGVETSMATLGNLYGINVDHYIRINFAGFINIVDALGGVDVYSDQAFTSVGSPGYYDPTTFAEGWNHLDGM